MGRSILTAWPIVLTLLGSVQIRGIDGSVLRLFEPSGIANVLVFVATDCPVANSYAPEIQRLCTAYAPDRIACSLIYEDVDVTAAEVRKHLDEHRYHDVPAAIDRDGAIAAKVGATVTPEVVVVDKQGSVRYRGRIDNFYAALGRPRQVVTVHDLQDALNALVAGQSRAAVETEPIGCYIVPSNLRRK